MGMQAIAFGILFLINPMRHVIDVLPDCIGCLLIIAGLRKPAMLVEQLQTARTLFWRLFLVTLLRTASIPLSLANLFSTTSTRLALTFIFSILELVFLLPAMKALVYGMVYAGMRFGGDSVLRRTKKGRDRADGVYYLTLLFFPVRALTNLLPELTALQLTEEDAIKDAIVIGNFYELLFWMSAVACGVLGLIWGIKAFQYIRGAARDTVLTAAMRKQYDRVIQPDQALQTAVSAEPMQKMLVLVPVFMSSLYFDHMDILPGAAAAVVLLLMLWMMRAKPFLCAVPVMYGAASAVASIVYNNFFTEYRFGDVVQWDNAAAAYLPVSLWMAAESVAGCACAVLLGGQLNKTVASHFRLLGVDVKEQSQDFGRPLRRRVTVMTVFLCLTQIANVTYILSAPYVLSMWLLNLFTGIPAIVSAVVLQIWTTENLYDRLRERA